MTERVAWPCPKCGRKYAIPVGARPTHCPDCRKHGSQQAGNDRIVRYRCRGCGKRSWLMIAEWRSMAGTTLRCPQCEKTVRIPTADEIEPEGRTTGSESPAARPSGAKAGTAQAAIEPLFESLSVLNADDSGGAGGARLPVKTLAVTIAVVSLAAVIGFGLLYYFG